MTLPYSGTFFSTFYSKVFCRGNVWLQVPVGMFEAGTTNPVDAEIQYLGSYRFQEKSKIQIMIAGQAAQSKDEFVTPSNNPIPGKLTFKIESIEGDKITGVYELSNPQDIGLFTIEKGDNHANY